MTSNTRHISVLIIGSGPAGYTAAIYTARANLKPVIVSGMQPGGQMTTTTDVENYPGFADVIQGPWLMDQMKAQAEHVGTEMINDTIIDVDFKSTPNRLTGDSGTIYTADTVIIATGAQARWLGLDTEEQFKGFGVSACATCDGFFYRGKEVMVIGGGNTAVEEALFLTKFASKVTLVHRRDTFRAEKILQDRLFKNEKIEIIYDHALEEVVGNLPGSAAEGAEIGVTAAKIKHVKTGDVTEIALHGVFVAIGHKPSTGVFKTHIDMDDEGYILSQPDSTKTDIPGIFAAGDVTDKTFRQAVTAAGMGCMAALEAEKYITELEDASKDAA